VPRKGRGGQWGPAGWLGGAPVLPLARLHRLWDGRTALQIFEEDTTPYVPTVILVLLHAAPGSAITPDSCWPQGISSGRSFYNKVQISLPKHKLSGEGSEASRTARFLQSISTALYSQDRRLSKAWEGKKVMLTIDDFTQHVFNEAAGARSAHEQGSGWRLATRALPHCSGAGPGPH
jgi:hypothetical protein